MAIVLLILIAVFLVETFWSPVSGLRNHRWVSVYASKWRSIFDPQQQLNYWVVVFVILLPPILIIGLLTQDHRGFSGFLLEFILSVTVLLWALGPQTLNQFYDHSVQVEDVTQELSQAQAFLNFTHNAYLAVVFWFALLGPAGALAYRMLSVLNDQTQSDEPDPEQDLDEPDTPLSDLPRNELQKIWSQLFYLADWLPARVSGFLFLLTGDFFRGFKEFKPNLFDTKGSNVSLVGKTGLNALALTEEDEPIGAAKALSERSLILLLVLVALMAFFSF